MSFSDYENSNNAGRPVKLYEFIRQSKSWLYTNADQDIVYAGRTYQAIAMHDTGFTQSGDADADTIQITLPYDADVCKQYERTPTSDSVSVIIRRKHVDDPDDDANVVWAGTVTGYSRPDLVSRVLACNNVSVSFTRGGLRLSWGRGCPHMLYDRNCGVDKSKFAVAAIATVIDAVNINVDVGAAYAAGWFTGGFMEWEIEPGLFERRAIESHTGNRLVIFGTTDWLTNGQNVVLYPGCSRIISVCNDKFNNLPNYGGFKDLPGKSPFDGDPVF